MKQQRRRKCRGCGALYHPDYRNHRHQRYCAKAECRHASKVARQAKWRASPKGCDYFLGPENVLRVQEWRKAHPGYWQQKEEKSQGALQDACSSQPTGSQEVMSELMRGALQDVCSSQPVLLVGLVSSLTGSALQDDIATSLRRFHARGQQILGTSCPHVLRTTRCRRVGLGIATKGADRDGLQTSARRDPPSPRAAAVQLG